MFEELIVETDSVLLFAELGVIGGIQHQKLSQSRQMVQVARP